MFGWLKKKEQKPERVRVTCEYDVHFEDGMECHGTYDIKVSRSAEYELARAIREHISECQLGVGIIAVKVYNIEPA